MIEFVLEEYKSNCCARGLQNFMLEECKCYILFRKNINVIFFVRRLLNFLQEKCKCYILCKKNTNVIFCARGLQNLCEEKTNVIINARRIPVSYFVGEGCKICVWRIQYDILCEETVILIKKEWEYYISCERNRKVKFCVNQIWLTSKFGCQLDALTITSTQTIKIKYKSDMLNIASSRHKLWIYIYLYFILFWNLHFMFLNDTN